MSSETKKNLRRPNRRMQSSANDRARRPRETTRRQKKEPQNQNLGIIIGSLVFLVVCGGMLFLWPAEKKKYSRKSMVLKSDIDKSSQRNAKSNSQATEVSQTEKNEEDATEKVSVVNEKDSLDEEISLAKAPVEDELVRVTEEKEESFTNGKSDSAEEFANNNDHTFAKEVLVEGSEEEDFFPEEETEEEEDSLALAKSKSVAKSPSSKPLKSFEKDESTEEYQTAKTKKESPKLRESFSLPFWEVPVKTFPSPGKVFQAEIPLREVHFPILSQKDLKFFDEERNWKNQNQLLNWYVSKLEKFYQHKFPHLQRSIRWIAKSPKLHNTFWLAIDPRYDDVPEAITLLAKIGKKYPEKVTLYSQLAVAVAVVWDQPDSIASSRYFTLWRTYQESQFPEFLTGEEIFAYFTEERMRPVFAHDLAKMQWPFLIHLVNLDITKEEVQWVIKNYASKRKQVAQTYLDVAYDLQRLETNQPSLGDREYTLENILEHDGVCGDQAHFMTRIAKVFGIPAMKIGGDGTSGISHAWGGYLQWQKKKASLLFAGRTSAARSSRGRKGGKGRKRKGKKKRASKSYRSKSTPSQESYYASEIADPQKRYITSENLVQMQFDAISKSYNSFLFSNTLAKIASELVKENPELSQDLFIAAIKNNPKVLASWEVMHLHLKNGHFDTKKQKSWWAKTLRDLQNYPDASSPYVNTFLDKMSIKSRQKYYKKITSHYKKRPDIQVQFLMRQCEELTQLRKSKLALQYGMSFCQKNIKEAAVIIPLLEKGVEMAKAMKAESLAKKALQKIARSFPKTINDLDVPAYGDLERLIGMVD